MLESRLAAWLRPVIMLVATAGILSLTACGGGSGAPNNPYAPGPTLPSPVVVLPASGTIYSGFPFTLDISGGTPPYTAVSSNQTLLPVTKNLSGSTVVLLAASVDADTAVVVTIADNGGQTVAVPIQVKPALLLPTSVTITGSPACTSGGDLCSGTTGTAKVKVTGPGGAGLSGRQVKFDVVQGAYAILSNNPAQPQVQTLTVVTDQNGDAVVGLVVGPSVVSQLGIIRATELASGVQVTGQFTIIQQIAGTNILSAIPNGKTTITGPDKATCSTGVRVSHYFFGGTPPYRVTTNFPDAVTLTGSPVTVQGGRVDVITNGVCFIGLTFAVVDANGLTLTSPPTVDNVVGTADVATPPPTVQPLTVSPSGYTITAPQTCLGATFPFTITGTTPFSAAASVVGVILNPNPIPNSPGQLQVSNVPSGTTSITIGDGSTPQQLAKVQITCP